VSRRARTLVTRVVKVPPSLRAGERSQCPSSRR